MRGMGLVAVVLLASGGVWWLLREDQGPAAGPTDTTGDRRAPEEAPALATAAAAQPAGPTEPPATGRFEGVSDLERLFKGLWLNGERTEAAARWVELIRADPSLLATLVRRMHPDHDGKQGGGVNIQAGVTQVLLALGPSTLDFLRGELDDANAFYRTRVVALVGGFRAQAARLVPELLERMDRVEEDPPAGEVASYVYALAWIGPAAEALLPRLEAWADDENAPDDIQVAALQGLGAIGGPSEALFTRYREVLRETGMDKQRGAVLYQLRAMGPAAAPMIPELLALETERLLHPRDVYAALTAIGVEDPEAVRRAESRLRDLEAEDYGWMPQAQYLASLEGAPRARLLALARTRDATFRVQLVHAIRRAGVPHGQLLDLIRPALHVEDAELRHGAWSIASDLDQLAGGTLDADVLEVLRTRKDAASRTVALGVGSLRRPLSATLAETILLRLEDAGELPEVRGVAAEILVHRDLEATPRLFDAILALHAQEPQRGACEALVRFLPTRTREVLAVWVADVERRGPTAGFAYRGPVARLPRATRLLHATAVRALGVDPDTGKPLPPAQPTEAQPGGAPR